VNKPEREGFVATEKVEDEDLKPQTQAEMVANDTPVIEEEVEDWPLTIQLLHKPIEIKRGVEVSELTFREPTAGDIMRAGGNPCKVEIVEMGGGRVTWQPVIDDPKMLRLMASLSGVLEPLLQRMDPRDYASCAHRLRRFFLPEQGIW
jgi:hypothetical protein